MIYLNTHMVVWLYVGLTEKFSDTGRELINNHEIFVSPVVRLELQYLHEIQRVTDEAQTIVTDLSNRIGLLICDKPLDPIVTRALTLSWTRDPFNRLIVANAALNDNYLLSKDQNILENYAFGRW